MNDLPVETSKPRKAIFEILNALLDKSEKLDAQDKQAVQQLPLTTILNLIKGNLRTVKISVGNETKIFYYRFRT